MKIRVFLFTLASTTAFLLPFLTIPRSANALFGSDACKDVIFRVDNNYGEDITVERFELWSQDEGRWLNENFRDVVVPAGEQAFTVRDGENVEYGEGDHITRIRVHFRVFEDISDDAPAEWYDRTRVDNNIANPRCRARKVYRATVNR